MRTLSFAGLVASLAFSQTALAQETLDLLEPDSTGSLELAVDLGVLDRGTTGVGDPLLGLGYDHGGGLQAGIGARAYLEINEYFRHGLSLRVSHQAGSALGLVGEHGFAWSQLDVAYVFRTSLPCMSDGDTQWYLSGLVGVTGVHADAGTGDAPRDERWNERVAAADDLDHLALGGMLGAGLDLHFDEWFVGALLDVREPFALGSGPVSRSFVTSGTLRAGVELEL